ncbi:DedA family protein [Pseudooceanicola sp. LIPI14-2-Ac024]|uniref:DedA family protein n=1 Tax=Pseudooceanicola sp. LIPI14-2-Ac024 TaxID=3344875 RepID=UPI0035CE9F32
MSFESLVQSLGLPGLFLGAMVEGEVATFLGGAMAHRGVFSFEAAALTATAGAVIADQAVFLVGRFARGWPLVQRVLSHRHAVRVSGMVERYPARTVLSLRFIYGARTVGLLLLGAKRIAWPTFAVLNLISVLVWAHLVTALGYGVALSLRRLLGDVPLHWHLIASIAVALAGLGLIGLWHRRRRKDNDSGDPV